MYFRSCFSILITDIVKWNIHVLLKIFIADYVHFNISKLESLRRGRNVFVWCWSWKVKNGWFLFPPHLSFFFVFFFVTVNVNQGKKKKEKESGNQFMTFQSESLLHATGGVFHFDGSLKSFQVSVLLLPCLSLAASLEESKMRRTIS